jgi:hypothetical protein
MWQSGKGVAKEWQREWQRDVLLARFSKCGILNTGDDYAENSSREK